MSRADYAHWNEDADFMWWHEEGKHIEEPPEPDDDCGRWDDEPEHHANPGECIAAGNFSHKSADVIDGTEIWRCDGCEGDWMFVESTEGMVWHAQIGNAF